MLQALERLLGGVPAKSTPVSATSNTQHELRSKHFAREAAEWIMMACRLGDLRTGQR